MSEIVFVKEQYQKINNKEYGPYYYLYQTYYNSGMKEPTNFLVGKVDDSIDSIIENYKDKANNKDLNISKDEIEDFRDKLEHIDENANNVEEKVEMIKEHESDPEDNKEEDSSENSYGGIGGGRRKKLDKIEEFDSLKTLEKSDIQSKEDIERFIKEMEVPGVAYARGEHIDMDDVLDRLDEMYGDLPSDEARSAYVNDTKLFRTLRSARRHFNKLVSKEKSFAEMPSAVEAGPANYPTGKRDKKRKSLRKQKDKLEEKVDRLYGRLKGARQRALKSVGTSVGEQNEKKRESQREEMVDYLQEGWLVRFFHGSTDVGRIKRVNKKSVTFEYWGYKHSLGDGDEGYEFKTYNLKLPSDRFSVVEAEISDEALKDIEESDFDYILDMDDSEVPNMIDKEFLEGIRDDEDSSEEDEEEDVETVVLKSKSEDGEVSEYDVAKSKAEDNADALIDAEHGNVQKIWIDGEVYYEDDASVKNDRDYEDLLGQNVPEVKSDLSSYSIGEYPKILEEEKNHKNRKTIVKKLNDELDDSDWVGEPEDGDIRKEINKFLEFAFDDPEWPTDEVDRREMLDAVSTEAKRKYFVEREQIEEVLDEMIEDGELEQDGNLISRAESDEDIQGMNETAVKELTRQGAIVEKDAAEMLSEEDVKVIESLDTPPMYINEDMVESLRSQSRDVFNVSVSELDGDESIEYSNVEITGDVPEFVGVDLDLYGGFDGGEVVTLPEDNAEILVNRGLAEEVEEEDEDSSVKNDKVEDYDIDDVADYIKNNADNSGEFDLSLLPKEFSDEDKLEGIVQELIDSDRPFFEPRAGYIKYLSDDGSDDSNESWGSDDEDYVMVEFVQKTPEFMGTDLQNYGGFEKGDTKSIPEDNAEILVNRGNAEYLNNSDNESSSVKNDSEGFDQDDFNRAMKVIEENDSGGGADYKEVVEEGVSKSLIDNLKSRGDVYEPTAGRLKNLDFKLEGDSVSKDEVFDKINGREFDKYHEGNEVFAFNHKKTGKDIWFEGKENRDNYVVYGDIVGVLMREGVVDSNKPEISYDSKEEALDEFRLMTMNFVNNYEDYLDEYGEDKSVHEKDMERLEDKVVEFLDEQWTEDGMGTDYKVLKDHREGIGNWMEINGFTEDMLEEAINNLLSEGVLYEPAPGKIKKL